MVRVLLHLLKQCGQVPGKKRDMPAVCANHYWQNCVPVDIMSFCADFYAQIEVIRGLAGHAAASTFRARAERGLLGIRVHVLIILSSYRRGALIRSSAPLLLIGIPGSQ